MPISPIITFKAGRCDVDDSEKPYKVKPQKEPGYIYLYFDDDQLIHFCWRERSKTLDDEDNLDLTMFPADGTFTEYKHGNPSAKTNGRIYLLKFTSSSSRHLYWLQSKPQAGAASVSSPRDQKIAEIVHTLLQGAEEADVENDLAQLRSGGGGGDGAQEDQDESMEDVEGHGDSSGNIGGGAGGAGAGATGGDVREEGSGAREGGADGGRAASAGPTDASTVVQNFLNSLKGGVPQEQQQATEYPTLIDLLPSSTTIPIIDSATEAQVDNLFAYLPPTILLIESAAASGVSYEAGVSESTLQPLNLDQKKRVLKRVLRSPQFHQSLGSLTMAIRDGGLPSIADALGIRLKNNGVIQGGTVPLGGGQAMEAFVEGVKDAAKK